MLAVCDMCRCRSYTVTCLYQSENPQTNDDIISNCDMDYDVKSYYRKSTEIPRNCMKDDIALTDGRKLAQRKFLSLH